MSKKELNGIYNNTAAAALIIFYYNFTLYIIYCKCCTYYCMYPTHFNRIQCNIRHRNNSMRQIVNGKIDNNENKNGLIGLKQIMECETIFNLFLFYMYFHYKLM